MKKLFFQAFFILVILFYGLPYGIDIDDDGNIIGLSSNNVVSRQVVVTPMTFSMSTTKILMDYSHGVMFSNYPNTKYNNLKALLEAQGHTVVASNAGILNLSLNNYEVIMLSTVWSRSRAYSSAEVNALQNYIDNGGNLFIVGEASGCSGCSTANSNLSKVSNNLAGITLGISTISPSDLYFSNFQPHEIFNGINELYYRYAGGLRVVAPGTELAYTDSFSAVTVAGYGKIIVVGDGSFLKDGDYWNIADDQLFIENIFNFFSYTKGDINKDGIISIVDAQLLMYRLRIGEWPQLSHLPEPSYMELAADMNDDGILNEIDLDLLWQLI